MSKKQILAVAASHLDTSWEWTFEVTAEKFIPPTLYENFALFEKYPEYKFGWEGAYRYELMEEYYPEAFEELKKYVAEGRWVPTGSSYENGDCNKPSPEALFRNILYGNGYFMKKFGVKSNDIFLPDCFGFGWSLPAIARHAGLKGFTTQKLGWGSAYGVPFDLGRWYGSDGSWIYASIDMPSYTRKLDKNGLRGDKKVAEKLENNDKLGLDFTDTFYGVGDKGQAPKESCVKILCDEIAKNPESDVEVISETSCGVFDRLSELPDEVQKRLPTWNNELLLTNHGAGSYTSRTVGNRWNKNCERLADYAEKAAVSAMLTTGAKYPQQPLDDAWKAAIAHQFHDDLTGTSLMICYNRNWNDYMLSQNRFVSSYKASVAEVASKLDTSFAKGVAVVVNNPVAHERTASVEAELRLPAGTKYVRVKDAKGKEVPSQLAGDGEAAGKVKVVFIASVPSMGMAVYDVAPADKPYFSTDLFVSSDTLENPYIRVQLDGSGNICSIVDKTTGQSALSAPVRDAAFAYDGNEEYPAWEVDYPELCKKPREYAAGSVSISEFGPARGVLTVKKTVGRSTLSQKVILDAASRFVRVENELDWRDERTLLKVVFPAAAKNALADYDLGIGVISRGVNNERLYEVPAQVWADITDAAGGYGMSVFSDSRSGWDKPDDNTLRLTVVHTPKHARLSGSAQNLLDLGLNRYGWAILPHSGSWKDGGTQLQAQFFNEPLAAFESPAHKGSVKGSYSLGSVSDENVLVRAVKKAQDSEKIVVRFNEANGEERKNVRFRLARKILSAKEIYADETLLGDAEVDGGELVFDIGAYRPRSFMLTVDKPRKAAGSFTQTPLDLPLDIRAMTCEGSFLTLEKGLNEAIPLEIVPDVITAGGVDFNLVTAHHNAMRCEGQIIDIPEGATRLYLVAGSAASDKNAVFKLGDTPVTKTVLSMKEPFALWDMIGLGQVGRIKRGDVAWVATHSNSREKVLFGKQLLLFRLSFDVPAGAKTLRLPVDSDLIVFAATATDEKAVLRSATALVDRLDERPNDYYITTEAYITLRPKGKAGAFPMKTDEKGNKYVHVSALAHDAESFNHPRDEVDN
ncbi:MAG: hypothetical protein K6C36_03620 [Clostridia bacterium]|nr:hypothetical protein [Clostridia bacterium]